MDNKKKANLVFRALNLFALGTQTMAHADERNFTEQKHEQLTAATLKSIENSYLKVMEFSVRLVP